MYVCICMYIYKYIYICIFIYITHLFCHTFTSHIGQTRTHKFRRGVFLTMDVFTCRKTQNKILEAYIYEMYILTKSY